MPKTDWKQVCAACAEGTPPERCAYYGDPNGCNAPTLGAHPEGDLAERLQEALEKAERRIAESERDGEKSERKFTDAKYEIKGLVDISEHLLEYIGRVSIARAAGEEPSDDDMEAFTEGIMKMRERVAHAKRKFLQEDGGAE